MADWEPMDVVGLLATGERVPRKGDIYKVKHAHLFYELCAFRKKGKAGWLGYSTRLKTCTMQVTKITSVAVVTVKSVNLTPLLCS